MKRAALYMRVSTDQQAHDGDSIAAQRAALSQYVKDHDMITAGEYMDDGVSGQKYDRDDLQRLLDDVRGSKVDVILFTKLDRWFRSVRHYTATQEILDRHGVTWMAIWEPMYDTTTPSGRLVVNQMMSIAQFEAENTSQRIKSVFAYKAAKGEVLSGHQPYGYSIVDKHLVPNEDAENVEKIFEHYSRTAMLGETMRYAASLGCVRSMPNIKKMLRNEKYIGVFRGTAGYCPPIISKDLFESVQRQLGQIVKSNTLHEYIFSGLVRCPMCGHKMTGIRIYQYGNGDMRKTIIRRESGYGCTRAGCAYGKKYLERKIEAFILKDLDRLVLECEIAFRRVDNSKEIAAAKSRLDRLKELYLNGIIPIEEYKADREALEAHIAALAPSPQPVDLSAVKSLINGPFTAIYDTLTSAEKRYIWRSVIKSITPHREDGRRSITCDVEFL